MEIAVTKLGGGTAGKIKLADEVFGLAPRPDILQRMVRWQLAKRQAGSHKTKGRHEVNRTGAKMYRQKGTGNARHGDRKVPQFRGGGRAHGPVPRSHAIGLPKKVRALALKHALSAKAASQGLVVLDAASVEAPKTKLLQGQLERLGLGNALIVDGNEIEANFRLAARNIAGIDVLPARGINVYDIMRREKLVLTKAAIEALEARFK